MKKILIFLVGLIMIFSLNSCETYTYATTQDDIYTETSVDVVQSNVSFDIIIRYGTPYYYNGSLLYYLYDGLYYYPYWYNDYWYVRAYRRPFNHYDHRPYFRPHRYDYRFRPGDYRGFNRPNVRHHHHSNMRPNHHQNVRPNNRPNVRPNNRPNVRPNNRPNVRPYNRPNVRPYNRPNINPNRSSHGGRYGGRR